MAEDLQARLAQADRPYVDGILAQVNALTSGASREARDREGLLTLMQQVLALVTEPMVLQILSDRLVEITNDSHDDFISVAKPSVARLTFSPAKDEPNLDPYAEPRPIAGGEGTVDDYG